MFNNRAIRLLSEVTGQKLIFPFYHTISDKPLPHLENLYPVKSIAEFEKDLIFLLRNFKPIELSEITDCEHVKERSFHLSFDDGFSGIYYHIAPLLKKYSIPATFFVSSAFIDNKDIMFRCKASLLIQNIQHKQQNSSTLKNIAFLLSTKNSVKEIKKALLAVPYEKQNIFNVVAKFLDFSFDEYLDKEKPYLTKEQITELSQDGFTFGSHSHDHPLFSGLEINEQIRQIQQSLQEIHNITNHRARTFSFPFTDDGIDLSFFNAIQKEIVPPLRFTFGTAGIKNDSYPCNYQRIPVEINQQHISYTLAFQYIKYIAKMPLRRNNINRY